MEGRGPGPLGHHQDAGAVLKESTPAVDQHIARYDLRIRSHGAPIEFVPCRASGVATIPEAAARRILLYSIHDGDTLPSAFLVDRHRRPIDVERFGRDYVRERDWGAASVAERLAEHLGVAGAWRVRTARVLLDFGRFPGETRGHEGHLERLAVNTPFCHMLSWDQKRAVLEEHYDVCSDALEAAIETQTIFIGIHTYDAQGPKGQPRPEVSLISRPLGYDEGDDYPLPSYDDLYPRVLAQSTADRILRDRISLTVEKAGVPVGHDFPYKLPEGCLEVRSQVFFFFQWLRERFEAAFPDTHEDPAYEAVWAMLLDTNLRSSRAEGLRAYLHKYRHAPPGRKLVYRKARGAYEAIGRFLEDNDLSTVYRQRRNRPSSLGIEVRKDLVWSFDDDELPAGPKEEGIDRIARLLARAVATYCHEDRPEAWG